MKTLADDVAVLDYDAANHRVGPHAPQSAGRQLQATMHKSYVSFVLRHIWFGAIKILVCNILYALIGRVFQLFTGCKFT